MTDLRHRPASAGCVAPSAQTGPPKAGVGNKDSSWVRPLPPSLPCSVVHHPHRIHRMFASPAPTLPGIHLHFMHHVVVNQFTTTVCTHQCWLCARRSLLRRRDYSLWWTRMCRGEFAALKGSSRSRERRPPGGSPCCGKAAILYNAATSRPRRSLRIF